MTSRLAFILKRLRERLWVRPLMYCFLSVGGALFARVSDTVTLPAYAPDIAAETNKALLSIMAASMLVIATLSVTSMVSAYASASSAATPRTFPLILADDVSQKALSAFLGAFIYAIVALVAVLNSYYGQTGHLVLFVATLAIFAGVVLTFVRWVDSIARLGRLGTAVDKVEKAASDALLQRARCPALGGICEAAGAVDDGREVFSDDIGYVQHIDMAALQEVAKQYKVTIHVRSLPGQFVTPGHPLVIIVADVQEGPGDDSSDDEVCLRSAADAARKAFLVGDDRVFDDDPRFGLIVLSEIAGKALSPAVNDPGTAIDIIGTLTRLLLKWDSTTVDPDRDGAYDRVHAPPLNPRDLFDDAFTSIARDGAAQVEVAVRLQKGLAVLAARCSDAVAAAAHDQSRVALERADNAMNIEADRKALRAAAEFVAGT